MSTTDNPLFSQRLLENTHNDDQVTASKARNGEKVVDLLNRQSGGILVQMMVGQKEAETGSAKSTNKINKKEVKSKNKNTVKSSSAKFMLSSLLQASCVLVVIEPLVGM